MSTEINLDDLYNNSIKILTDLIGFRTISGEDNSALINYCEDYLGKLGATSFKTFDKDKKLLGIFEDKTNEKRNWESSESSESSEPSESSEFSESSESSGSGSGSTKQTQKR